MCLSGGKLTTHTNPTSMHFGGTGGDLSQVTKEYILERVPEEAIMERYLGVPVKVGRLFRNPLRQDKAPTCLFSYYKGRLKFRDWAWQISKDCFDVVMMSRHCSYDDALQIVARDFGVLKLAIDPSLEERRKLLIEREEEFGGKSLIQVKTQDFTPTDAEYFKSFGITRKICEKYRVFSIEYLWLNTRLNHVYTPHDPAIGYYFGEGAEGEQRWKIYFPRRKKGDKRPRFFCNTNRIAGWVQIPESGPLLVLTKSMKDVMVLDRLGIPALSMQNETTEPYPEIIEGLKGRFSKLFTLYDYDLTGVRMANRLKKLHGIYPLFLTGDSKDISDLVRDEGLEQAQRLVDYARRRFNLP